MIFSAFERKVALRYLKPRRQEGFVSVIAGFSLIGIALGVATLIIVMSVMNGFRSELMTRILGVNGHLTIYADSGRIENYDEILERVRGISRVVLADPQVQGQAMVTSGDQATGALVRGLDREALLDRPLVAENIVAGDVDRFDGESVLVGIRLARQLGLRQDGQITLLTPRGETTVIGSVPRIKSFPIAGLFEIGMYEYDSGFIYMPLEAAQTYFRLPEAVNAIEVFLDDPDAVGRVRSEVASILGPSYRVVDWQQANSSFFNAIQVERNVMFLILTLIILVAAFNIISSQIMLVKDKGADIAILRTMGATQGSVMRIFMLSGASIGFIGTALGFVLGLAFSLNIEAIRQWLQSLTGTDLFAAEIYFLSRLPAEVDPGQVTLVVAMALSLSFLATLYPSWRAARLDPVEALRYE